MLSTLNLKQKQPTRQPGTSEFRVTDTCDMGGYFPDTSVCAGSSVHGDHSFPAIYCQEIEHGALASATIVRSSLQSLSPQMSIRAPPDGLLSGIQTLFVGPGGGLTNVSSRTFMTMLQIFVIGMISKGCST